MDSYLDTSFLLKLYLVELDSDNVVAWMRENRGTVFLSSLSDIEAVTVLSKQSPVSIGARAISDYHEDLANGVFQKLEIGWFSSGETICKLLNLRNNSIRT